ncbi:MAG: LytTR family DNA-binding domain-containing protein [Bacteroidota bacterium]|nr:LytTR family DNA-binding domain-containing protein [Bacteroidota bacterium]
MRILNCIIVDDEPLQGELLSDYINKTPFLSLTGTYSNPLEALTVAQQQNVDLIFSDIQMPELSGIQFIQLLSGKSKFIFITAYPNYALQGYELDVVDYLVKPVSFERFLKAANKALQLFPPLALQEDKKAGNPVSFNEQVIFVKADYKIIKIALPDILFIEGLKEYIAIHTTKGKVITLQTMKKMEEVLPLSHFSRVHKSFIVARDKIDSIERKRIFIKNNVIPIGETYDEAFFKILNNNQLL